MTQFARVRTAALLVEVVARTGEAMFFTPVEWSHRCLWLAGLCAWLASMLLTHLLDAGYRTELKGDN